MDKVKERVDEKTFKEKFADVCGYIILLGSVILMVWLSFVNEVNGQELEPKLKTSFEFKEEFLKDSVTGARRSYLTVYTRLDDEFRVIAYSPPSNTRVNSGGALGKETPCPLWFYSSFKEKGVRIEIRKSGTMELVAEREFR
jgi:hypothetical protein